MIEILVVFIILLLVAVVRCVELRLRHHEHPLVDLDVAASHSRVFVDYGRLLRVIETAVPSSVRRWEHP